MKEVNVKLRVEECLDTARLADLTLISLLLGIDSGDVVGEGSLVVFFPLIHGGERVVRSGTDELHELMEIRWL